MMRTWLDNHMVTCPRSDLHLGDLKRLQETTNALFWYEFADKMRESERRRGFEFSYICRYSCRPGGTGVAYVHGGLKL